ncbi:hypothetical protein BpHYR1_001710 [Brachionus plicatilis]|uniref:Uncharacterized protein n=1 Tax=Brachionus plicatilis TaxID=10195 RepID=A0A3M7SZV1_BRAPC|nr:hypothetical protein BpHYR1_001710 [Brachionus plicatilis]
MFKIVEFKKISFLNIKIQLKTNLKLYLSILKNMDNKHSSYKLDPIVMDFDKGSSKLNLSLQFMQEDLQKKNSTLHKR